MYMCTDRVYAGTREGEQNGSLQYFDFDFDFEYMQWWASYFHKVTELLYFCYWWKKLATFNPLPTCYCNGSVTVTSY